MDPMTPINKCWCGNADLAGFSPDYLRCDRCGTLVLKRMPTSDVSRVTDDSADLYGRNYYLERHTDQYRYPSLAERVRSDLPERCLHWLRTALAHRPPPGRVLELGSGHGGFVAMLKWSGYDAQGLELSPWVVEFSRSQFDIDVLQGPIEDQPIDPGSLQLIALMDVLEHLPDPLATMRHCKALLAPEGAFLIQTPQFIESMTYEGLVESKAPFLEQFKPDEHLFLFSKRAVEELFDRVGVSRLTFEPAIFSQYDMYFIAERNDPIERPRADLTKLEFRGDQGKLIRALLDSDELRRTIESHLQEVEQDRSERLRVLQRLGEQGSRLESELNTRIAEIHDLKGHLAATEKDRADRLDVIHAQGEKICQLEASQGGLLAELENYKSAYLASEKDRADRLVVIEELCQERDELRRQLASMKSRRW